MSPVRPPPLAAVAAAGAREPTGTGRWRGAAHLMVATAADYVRNPVNPLFLVLVPAVFVIAAADALAEAAALLGGNQQASVYAASAGWAASFLCGVAMYFQVAANRAADRRLVLAGFPAAQLTMARLATGLLIVLVATGASLLALVARGDLTSPWRTLAGTLMAGLVYLGTGAAVAVLLPDPLNGTMLLLFIWILDVFFGPVLGGSQAVGWRLLPTHFTTFWSVDVPSTHAGAPGDLGWGMVWVTAALATAFLTVSAVAPRQPRHPRPVRSRATRHPATQGASSPSVLARFAAAAGYGLRQLARTPVMWLLLAAVPAVFILLAEATTPHSATGIRISESGRQAVAMFDLADIHGGTMAPIAVASLAMLAGLFQAVVTRATDRRLVLTGFGWRVLSGARTSTALATAGIAVAASLLTAAFVFEPANWTAYVAGNLLLGVVYVLVGTIVGPLLGQVAGVFLAFLVPFLDVGLGQSPMLHEQPPAWARLLPGYGPSRVLLDGALTPGFDQWPALALSAGWVLALLLGVAWVAPKARDLGDLARAGFGARVGPSGAWFEHGT